MAKRPPDDDADGDLGAASPPGRRPLKPPSAEALRRAAPLFAQLVGLGAGPAKQPPAAGDRPDRFGPAAGAGRGPDPAPQRRYPLAARWLAASFEQISVAAVAAPAPAAAVAVDVEGEGEGEGKGKGKAEGDSTAAPAGLLPQLRGFVRKSVAGGAEAVPQMLLEDMAQMALVDGGSPLAPSSFVIVFREELLGELQCRLEVGPTGQITATFVAADAHTRRLLTREAPRLRAKLTGHGLHDVLLSISDS